MSSQERGNKSLTDGSCRSPLLHEQTGEHLIVPPSRFLLTGTEGFNVCCSRLQRGNRSAGLCFCQTHFCSRTGSVRTPKNSEPWASSRGIKLQEVNHWVSSEPSKFSHLQRLSLAGSRDAGNEKGNDPEKHISTGGFLNSGIPKRPIPKTRASLSFPIAQVFFHRRDTLFSRDKGHQTNCEFQSCVRSKNRLAP